MRQRNQRCACSLARSGQHADLLNLLVNVVDIQRLIRRYVQCERRGGGSSSGRGSGSGAILLLLACVAGVALGSRGRRVRRSVGCSNSACRRHRCIVCHRGSSSGCSSRFRAHGEVKNEGEQGARVGREFWAVLCRAEQRERVERPQQRERGAQQSEPAPAQHHDRAAAADGAQAANAPNSAQDSEARAAPLHATGAQSLLRPPLGRASARSPHCLALGHRRTRAGCSEESLRALDRARPRSPMAESSATGDEVLAPAWQGSSPASLACDSVRTNQIQLRSLLCPRRLAPHRSTRILHTGLLLSSLCLGVRDHHVGANFSPQRQ